MIRREQLEEGYSGTILYIKYGEQKLAFAMVIGQHFDRYQAILLKPALRDIEMDYRHHVAELSPLYL